MEYQCLITVPPHQAGSSRAKIALQMLPVARAEDYICDEEKGLVIFNFKSTFKQYIRVFGFFAVFNNDMAKKYKGRTFKYMAGKHYAEMIKYYESPASVIITKQPTPEELTDEEKSLFTKAKDWIDKNAREKKVY